MIPFNKPYYPETCRSHVEESINEGHLFRGNHYYKCVEFFKTTFGFETVIPTLSCTQALEFVAVLLNLTDKDEIIVPAYTYVSSANAFAATGAKIVLADSGPSNPNIDITSVKKLITPKTKAIVVVHYGGFSCDIEQFRFIADKHNLLLIEDVAHGIGSKYNDRYLGSFGDFATFSFHETKNITCGQGGMLIINNPDFFRRASIVKENGTNREDFQKGKTGKYVWMDLGSTFNLPELQCAVLYAGLKEMTAVNTRRKNLWLRYHGAFQSMQCVNVPDFTNLNNGNGHIFYMTLHNNHSLLLLSNFLKERNILAYSHYVALALSPYYTTKYGKYNLPKAELYSDTLLRLPMYYTLSDGNQGLVIAAVQEFFELNRSTLCF